MKVKDEYEPILFDRRSCPKNIMVFRKACFEEIGGFVPLKYGGEDTLACFMARMKGWKSWSFPDIETKHNKPLGSGRTSGTIKVHFNNGIGEYFLAYPPLFVILKSLIRVFLEAPYVIAGITRLSGYFYASFMKEELQIDEHTQNFIKKDLNSRVWNRNKIPEEYKYIEKST
jgi:GT2 family glycosyltransferase